MAIMGITSSATVIMQSLADMRAKLDDLQRQLATGEKSDSYAGLGPQRALTVGLQAQLDAAEGFDNTITMIATRMDLAQNSLTAIYDSAQSVKHSIIQPNFTLGQNGQVLDQVNAQAYLDGILSSLNVTDGTGYIFSGMSADKPSVETLDRIMNGDATHAGFKQILSERKQADLGAAGLGRLLIPVPGGTVVSVSEDVAGSPFGFKPAGVNSTLSGAVVAGPAGVPPAISVDLVTNVNAGETLKLTFTLPDGTTESVTLTATNSVTPGANEFAIGGSAAATATNLQAALTTAVTNLANTALVAASAVAAGDDFFDIDDANPPQRVNGPPFDTATSLIAGTSGNTVMWYTGEAGAGAARSTAVARVDAGTTVTFGLRANEEAIRDIVKNIAVYAGMSYSAVDPNASAQYSAVTSRLVAKFVPAPGQQSIADMQVEIANAQVMASTVKDRNRQSSVMIADFLQSIENVPAEQVGTELLALQTTLQASLQTTALLAKLSLVNYI
jgi:flagellin-like hook-associated protein FlgL